MSYCVGIAGATGYAGGEVARLLLGHPELTIGALGAHTSQGQYGQYQPHLLPLAHRELVTLEPQNFVEHDAVILALPHGASADLGAQIRQQNPEAVIVDVSADHRLESAADWAGFYGGTYSPAWTYGMPELIRASGPSQRERLAEAKEIAGPGCNASAVTFAAQPAVALGAGTDIVAVLSVGYSGAGKKAKTNLLAAEAAETAVPYGAAGTHRHIPEIAQNLRAAGASTTALSFTPVLVPMSRGILATVSIPVPAAVTSADVTAAYRDALAEQPFVKWSATWPTTKQVLGANTALVHAELDRSGGRITAVCALDNLVKGTAGAAIQSLNLSLGLAEDAGLSTVGVAP
ncbi:MAG: N-acetyl-gamma-glutamyl-phosphate reductase [Trueperella sp.]|nr:N-acetyl-gamma-glutamyl-phosphate reductase [Trueperella sp.]